MELAGKIKVLFDTQNISAKFRKRELVLVTDERYPQQILVEFTQDKISLLDRVSEGDEVRIQIDIRGREWKSPRGDVKYFVSIQGWRIDPLVADQPEGGGPDAPSDFGDVPLPDGPNGYGSSEPPDDIPF
ncbi:hypothetical protein PPSIR1_12798 [Plesiocystis pacifica SIR-1]|uniref:DUF3127 domain-containing protein n=1 Tax=Plesiocystis pacifica SIR-1 TaxID=391625 RepID=A6G064_9BACT|nr:DUF3127 domain-containing protein [Plesiocystis pacifica]EDM80761.1 hypothetical protein PPSIR1_12798 [Plesiocystis pacifica SIR-1]